MPLPTYHPCGAPQIQSHFDSVGLQIFMFHYPKGGRKEKGYQDAKDAKNFVSLPFWLPSTIYQAFLSWTSTFDSMVSQPSQITTCWCYTAND